METTKSTTDTINVSVDNSNSNVIMINSTELDIKYHNHFKKIDNKLLETNLTENDIKKVYDNEISKEYYKQLFECKHQLNACKMLSLTFIEGTNRPSIFSTVMKEIFKEKYNSIKYSYTLELSKNNRYYISPAHGDSFHKITCDITDTPIKAILYIRFIYPKDMEKRKLFFQGKLSNVYDWQFNKEEYEETFIPIKTVDKFDIKNDKYSFSFYEHPIVLYPFYKLVFEIIYTENCFKIYPQGFFRNKIKLERYFLPDGIRDKIFSEVGKLNE